RQWQALANVPLSQWVQSGAIASEPADDIAMLGGAYQDDMFALARLADPGPFERETHLLGTYLGIRARGELAAMAGERMRLPGYAEGSAGAPPPRHEGHTHGT